MIPKKISLSVYLGFFALLASVNTVIFSGNPLQNLLLHFFASVGVGSMLFVILKKVTKKLKAYPNTFITLILLFLIIHPVSGITEILLVILSVFIAIIVKFFITFDRKQICNPAAFSILFCTYLSTYFPDNMFVGSWWGTAFRTPINDSLDIHTSLIFITPWLLYCFLRYRRRYLLSSFFIIFYGWLFLFHKDTEFLRFIATDSTIVFFATVMMTDPKTSAIPPVSQILHGAIIAGISLCIHLGIASETKLYAIANQQYLLFALFISNVLLLISNIILAYRNSRKKSLVEDHQDKNLGS